MQLTRDMAVRILQIEAEKDKMVDEARKKNPGITWFDLVHRASGFVDCALETTTQEEALKILREIQR